MPVLLSCNNPVPHSLFCRRELFSNGISSSVSSHYDEPATSSNHTPPRRVENESCGNGEPKNWENVMKRNLPCTTRRALFASLVMFSCSQSSRYLPAYALGDPSVTVEQVTPSVYPAGALFPSEERVVQIFEQNTYSVVNIFDVTLRPQLNVTGIVEIPEGNGSGVVWDQQGHIVTNYHVIGSSLSRNPSVGQVVARVNILASEGVQKNFEGILVGADRTKDLAVLKVEGAEDILRPIKVGDSSSVRVGQQCLAIGNPFGFDHTLTVGVLSGLNRDIFSQTGVTIGGGIQTDAAINPGNSGGPLLNSKGNLIGINTAIFTQTGKHVCWGRFCYSILYCKQNNTTTDSVWEIRAGLNVDIAPDMIANQLNVRNGALVMQVAGNSLAAKAGLLPTTRGFAGNILLGDIIIAVDNKPVKSKAELNKVLDDYSVGDKVTLKVQRGSETLDVPVNLEETTS
ncbi:hypothetical protein V2J09_014125 [Rumex salicifolius]